MSGSTSRRKGARELAKRLAAEGFTARRCRQFRGGPENRGRDSAQERRSPFRKGFTPRALARFRAVPLRDESAYRGLGSRS